MNFTFKTDIGLTRSSNEDYFGLYHNQEELPLAILCDGMGGHNGGDVASQMAVEHMGNKWQHIQLEDFDEIEVWLDHQIRKENDRILAQANKYEDLKGMGTTIITAAFKDQSVLIANIGDSRAYLFKQGQLLQISEDHSFVGELKKKGEITAEEMRTHPQRNMLMQALGSERRLNVDFYEVQLQQQDIFMLATDGLYAMVEDQKIIEILSRPTNIKEDADALIQAALDAGGEDNVTVFLATPNHLKGDLS